MPSAPVRYAWDAHDIPVWIGRSHVNPVPDTCTVEDFPYIPPFLAQIAVAASLEHRHFGLFERDDAHKHAFPLRPVAIDLGQNVRYVMITAVDLVVPGHRGIGPALAVANVAAVIVE